VPIAVRNAWRAVRLARAGEALLLGVSGVLLALAAALRSGAALGEGASIAAALLTGAGLAGAWLVERWPRPAQVARLVDSRLGLDGALVTAFEGGAVADPAPLAALLDARVLARVRARDVVRAALPNSTPFLAVPFLAFALLGWCIERRPERADPRRAVAPLAQGLADELSRAVDAGLDAVEAGELGQPELQELMALEREGRELARRAGAHGASAQELDAAFAEVLEGVRDAARDMGTAPELTSALTRADALGEAARMGLEDALEGSGAGRAQEPPRAGDGAREDPSGAGGPGDGRDGAAGGAGGKPAPDLTNGGPDGRIPGRSPSATVPEDGDTPSPSADPEEAGVTAGRWWPDRHSGVVGRWVEARRAALEAAAAASSPPFAGD
jgi:hypothetical protein